MYYITLLEKEKYMNNSTEFVTSSENVTDNYENYLTITNDGLDIEANNLNVNCLTNPNAKFSLDSSGNLTVNSLTISDSNNNTLSFDAIFNRIYPIGAIYISTNDVNPGIIFTGTWEKIENVFLLASGSSFSLGSTGGEINHTLSLEEIPSHNHTYLRNKILYAEATSESGTTLGTTSTTNNQKTYAQTFYNGGSQAHNNMPPYLAVNVYKRVS